MRESAIVQISDEQKKVITRPSDTRTLVLAGPGTGKTFCLIERLKFLCTDGELNPGTEVLVLSFSVAAIKEVKNRLRQFVDQGDASEGLLFVKIRTFDSFASHFLLHHIEPSGLSGKDYDDRIKMAIDLIAEDEYAQNEIAGYKHVIVDEIQDLVGIRARLTQKVLALCGGGFTVLGDPAQAIYEYLVKCEADGPSSLQFLEWVRKELNAETLGLSVNFRVAPAGELAQLARDARKMLMDDDSDVSLFLQDAHHRLPQVGSLGAPLIPDELRNSNTCILCRTNGQVLRAARSLRDSGIPFVIRRPKNEQVNPAWIGRAFYRFDSEVVTKARFAEELVARLPEADIDPEGCWTMLVRAGGQGRVRKTLTIRGLRSSLVDGSILVDRNAQTPENGPGIILSTIHRSKGREFDNVIVVSDRQSGAPFSDDTDGEENRVLFVALTRARKGLRRMSPKGSGGVRLCGRERWIRSYGKKFTGTEVGLFGDVDASSFVSLKFLECIEDIDDNQDMLFNEVKSGDPAYLKLCGEAKTGQIYTIKMLRNGVPVTVGAMSSRFTADLKRCIKSVGGGKKIPGRIEDIWVRDIVTEVGDLGDEDVPRVLRTSGLWLGVRLAGLGKCRDWS